MDQTETVHVGLAPASAMEEARQLVETLERDDDKPWDEDFKTALENTVAAALTRARAEEREKVAQFMLCNSIATGHGDTTDDLLIELQGGIQQIRAAAREQTLEEAGREIDKFGSGIAVLIAQRVRALKSTAKEPSDG